MQRHTHQQLTGSTFFEWIPLLIIGIIGLAYLYMVLSLRKEKKVWGIWHRVSFMIGICLLATAMFPSIMYWGHANMRGHMAQHLLIAMYAPIFLVLGAPVTLILNTLPVKMARNLTTIMKRKFFQLLSHPVTALILNTGGMYLLYLTPLYNETLSKPYLHYLIHIHFLAAGYLFTWSVIGLDHVSKRPGFFVRGVVLFLSIATHSFLSKYMYAYLYPLNSPHTDYQIREGARLMYYWGDLSELLLAVVLFATWYYNRGKSLKMSKKNPFLSTRS